MQALVGLEAQRRVPGQTKRDQKLKFGSKRPALAHLLAVRQPIGFLLTLGCDLQWNIVTVEQWEGGGGQGWMLRDAVSRGKSEFYVVRENSVGRYPL
jgi:hypothetical protein